MPPATDSAEDHFARFGLSRKLGIDLEALETEFLRLSREFHPDRFAGAPEAERAEIQRSSARINDAYRTLRDPVARAEHLLALEGVERSEGEAKCPPDLLAEVFELRELLLEEPGPEVVDRVRRMAAEAEEGLADLGRRLDAAEDPSERAGILARIREALDRRKFVANLVREVEEGLSA
jgi:molecular chaperone HscB